MTNAQNSSFGTTAQPWEDVKIRCMRVTTCETRVGPVQPSSRLPRRNAGAMARWAETHPACGIKYNELPM